MIIQLLDGTSFDTADYNLKRLFHRIPSADIQHTLSSVDGRSDIITNSKLNNRIISVEFLYQVYDIYDYYLLRDRLNDLFVRRESFYIIFKREPYKRYKVKLASQFSMEPNKNMQSFTVDFITVNTYAESTFNTLTFQKEWDNNQHAWNNFIDWDSEPPKYSFNNNNFTVKNLGNVKIDPRQSQLKINLEGIFGNFVTINNLTTGEIYRYNGPVLPGDSFFLDGVRTSKNFISDFAGTNKKLLTLAVGDNNFTVEGGTVTKIDFEFRFLYK